MKNYLEEIKADEGNAFWKNILTTWEAHSVLVINQFTGPSQNEEFGKPAGMTAIQGL